MDINRLRYFAAVVESGSLRKAAEIVGISPPSMSKAMSVLETELGCKLTRTEGRGIGITEKGLEIYRMSTSLLAEYGRFQKGVSSAAPSASRLRIGTFEVFSTYFLSSFLATEPSQDVFLLEMTPGQIERAILEGSVDHGITYLPAPDPQLDFLEIGRFKMGIFGLNKWADQPFESWPFAVPTTELRQNILETQSLDMWPVKAPRRQIRYQFELLETALQTSRAGLSVLHCPDFLIPVQNRDLKPVAQLAPLPTPRGYGSSQSVTVYLVSRKGSASAKLERKLARHFRMLRRTFA